MRCYEFKKLINIQIFLHGNLEEAENYSFEIKAKTSENEKQGIAFIGNIISIDIPIANRENHSGTFTFTNSMARQWVCEIANAKYIIFNVAIKKDEIKS